jgi:DNA processing protein
MNTKDIYLLSKIKGIGPKAIVLIFDALKTAAQETINPGNYEGILAIKGIKRYQKALINIFSTEQYNHLMDEVTKDLEHLKKIGIKLVSISEPNYPQLLKQISDPPPLLYLKGNDQLLNQGISCAVVGSREHTERGKIIVEKTVDFLCNHQFIITSGLARGIDSIAHQQTLNNNGRTIAVLVDAHNIQPKSNTKLANRILEKDGLLVSENYPGVNIIPQLFAKRDRIQTGLSTAVFAIETSKSGGTRHAIEQAIESNCPVYVPDYDKSGYPDTSIPQLEGLKHYFSMGHAVKYTKEDYNNIATEINLRHSNLTK